METSTIKGKALIVWSSEDTKKMDAIDTDKITPVYYCSAATLEELDKNWKEGTFKYLIPDFRERVRQGQNFLVVGDYFGIGSSREMSPAGIKGIATDVGIEIVILCGENIGSIFYKNALNLGLKVISIPEAVKDAHENDEFELAGNQLTNVTQNKIYTLPLLSGWEEKLSNAGGIINLGKEEFLKTPKIKKDIIWPDDLAANNMSVLEQILYAHRVDKNAEIKVGNTLQIWADLLPASDLSAPFAIYTFNKIVGKDFLKTYQPSNAAIVCDHCVFTDVLADKSQLQISFDFAELHNIKAPFFAAPDSGIFHIYFPEKGLIHPGGFYAGADSHTRTYGGYGAFAIGVGSTTLGFGWANGYIYFTIPEQKLVTLKGKLQLGVTGKDVALALLKRWNGQMQNKSIEFIDADLQLPVHYRHTFCNLMSEAEVVNALIVPDSITYEWFKNRKIDLQYPHLTPGANAKYSSHEVIDISQIEPQVAVPFHPKNSVSVCELAKEKIKVQKAFIGSCTNGNYEDILEAAKVFYDLDSKTGVKHVVADGIHLMIYPGSAFIRSKMENKEPSLGGRSAREVLESAGAIIRQSWCGACVGLGCDALQKGEKAITTFNRNWANRMGVGGEGYLASPIIVASSAIAGYICGPDALQ